MIMRCKKQIFFLILFFLFSPCINAQYLPSRLQDWKSIPLPHHVFVIDGDTFSADLNQNGKIEKPQEWIRLLYVDTPELSQSHKGKNIPLGLRAKNYLRSLLETASSQRLWIDPKNSHGKYERLLGVLEVDQKNVNLALIQKGYSYFDTRYSLSPFYLGYSKAEAKAYQQKLGIWRTKSSRVQYLNRLQQEGKTIRLANNPRLVTEVLSAKHIVLRQYFQKFIRVRGTVKKVNSLRKGVQLWSLYSQKKSSGLQVVSFVNRRKELGLESLQKGDPIFVEGFVEQYRGRYQIKLHRGHKVMSVAKKKSVK